MDFAFSGGVKPGGLTSITEIRILICYLLFASGGTLTKEEMETALVGEELVNYFEYADAVSSLEESGLITLVDDTCTITEKGSETAQTLSSAVPYSVKERAVNAAVFAMQFNKKKRQNKVEIEKQADGTYFVSCSIADMQGPMFSLRLLMPDKLTANKVKDEFIEHGEVYFRTILNAFTGNVSAACDALQALPKKQEEKEE